MSDDIRQEYFDYLDELKESGKIKMIDAPVHLTDDFGLFRDEAQQVFLDWIDYKNQGDS